MDRYKKKKLLKLLLISGLCFYGSIVHAITLQKSIAEVIETNPIVKERINNYRATQQDLKSAESEFLPKLDYSAGIGYKDAGNLNDDVNDEEYKYYENSLKLTQNLFNGFDTTYKIDYQETRVIASAYHYLEKANDIAFRMVEAYLNVLKNYKLLQNAQDSVDFHKRMYKDAKSLYEAGLSSASSISKVNAGLALARTNYIIQKNNTRDAEFNFARVLGRKPLVSQMALPLLDIKMPETLERAVMYAIRNNPSLIVSHYNLEGAQALYKKSKSAFYPNIDFEIEQVYNDYDSDDNSFDELDDRFRVGLSLTWNLYNGGADKAAKQKAISSMYQETQTLRDLQRQVIEGLELSWSAYDNIKEQILQLEEYSKFSEETLISYKEEYSLGKRSLLDFITAHNDVVNSRAQMIKAKHEHLFAQYRLLDAMGLLITAVMGDQANYETAVNLNTNEMKYNLDTLPIKLDEDKDMLVDSIDICSNSSLANKDNIMPYGCIKSMEDPNKDKTLQILKNNKIFQEGNK